MDREKQPFSILVHIIYEFGVIFTNSQDAIEIGVRGRPLQKSSVFQLFDVG